MDHYRLDLLRAHCNELALKLVQKEHEENQQNIQSYGTLRYKHTSIDPLFQPPGNKTRFHSQRDQGELTPAQKALLMVELASRECPNREDKSKLAPVKIQENEFQAVKIEEQEENKEFPWEQINSLGPFSKFSKIKLKCLLTSFYRSHPTEVKKALKTFNIRNSEFQETVKAKQTRERRNQLRKQVLERSCHHPISLNEFKMLARRVYTNRWFRPTDQWCFSFLNKFKISDCINSSK